MFKITIGIRPRRTINAEETGHDTGGLRWKSQRRKIHMLANRAHQREQDKPDRQHRQGNKCTTVKAGQSKIQDSPVRKAQAEQFRQESPDMTDQAEKLMHNSKSIGQAAGSARTYSKSRPANQRTRECVVAKKRERA
jgi:hypothetical protein